MSSKPLILLTNDDGINAPGLRALFNAVNSLGEVVVIAPAVEKSAAGHSITLINPLRVHTFEYFESCLSFGIEEQPHQLGHTPGDDPQQTNDLAQALETSAPYGTHPALGRHFLGTGLHLALDLFGHAVRILEQALDTPFQGTRRCRTGLENTVATILHGRGMFSVLLALSLRLDRHQDYPDEGRGKHPNRRPESFGPGWCLGYSGLRHRTHETEFHRGAVIPKLDPVSVLKEHRAGNAPSVDQRPVETVQISKDPPILRLENRGMDPGNHEFLGRIELEIRLRFPTHHDVSLGEGYPLAGTHARQDHQLGVHPPHPSSATR